MSKRTIYIIAGLAVIIIILAILRSKGIIGSKTGIAVETALVSRQTIVETVNASGKIQPETEVKISADISGEIISLPVKEGDRVKKGQLLVRIKPDQYQRAVEKSKAGVNSTKAALAQAKAAFAQAQANFEKAKTAFNRNKKLYEQKAISTVDYQNFESDFKVAQAQLESARQSVKAGEYNLSSSIASQQESIDALNKTSIYSPIEGTISRLNVELGERVVGTMQMAGTELMRVADLSNMQVEVDVNENDIVRLHLEDTAIINVDAYKDRSFKGLVKEIASSAQSDLGITEKVTNFKVKIRILESSYSDMTINSSLPTPFRPGMTADVAIQTKMAQNIIAVPILAVTVRKSINSSRDSLTNNSEQEVVFLLKDGKAVQQSVKTGIQDDVYIEIKDGIKEKETVISGPFRTVSKELKDGDLVKEKPVVKNNGGKS
jgi:HlyD family secretion protein